MCGEVFAIAVCALLFKIVARPTEMLSATTAADKSQKRSFTNIDGLKLEKMNMKLILPSHTVRRVFLVQTNNLFELNLSIKQQQRQKQQQIRYFGIKKIEVLLVSFFNKWNPIVLGVLAFGVYSQHKYICAILIALR